MSLTHVLTTVSLLAISLTVLIGIIRYVRTTRSVTREVTTTFTESPVIPPTIQPERNPIAFRIKSPESINNTIGGISQFDEFKSELFECEFLNGMYCFKTHPLHYGWNCISHVVNRITSQSIISENSNFYTHRFTIPKDFLEEIIYKGEENV